MLFSEYVSLSLSRTIASSYPSERGTQLAMVNHSCLPNAAFESAGATVNLVALSDIPSGAEITHSYVDLYNPSTARIRYEDVVSLCVVYRRHFMTVPCDVLISAER